jgi:hypothetical protein|tara:strand:- start:227 stop:721 length:495 start_codon:yes stop_codon:yes gene_type:complete
MKTAITIILIIYSVVIVRVTFINESESIMIQKAGYFFINLFLGWAVAYFTWLYFEIWLKIAKKRGPVKLIRNIAVPLTPVGIVSYWRFSGGDEIVIVACIFLVVGYFIWGSYFNEMFKRFFLSRSGNLKFFQSFNRRYEVVPFDLVYLVINFASIYYGMTISAT